MWRGRRDPGSLHVGGSLDFWRMKVAQNTLFRPRGLAGHLYWRMLWPAHAWLFPSMLHRIVPSAERDALTIRAEGCVHLEDL